MPSWSSQIATPMYLGLIAFVAFVIGLYSFSGHREEMFTQWNVPMTVGELNALPKKLKAVQQYPMVTDHDYYYAKFGG